MATRPAFGLPASFGKSVLFAVSGGAILWVCGCASPGEPSERRAPVPAAITDLAALQQGNEVVLTFSLPTETIDKHPLKKTPTVEIYRSIEPISSSAVASTKARGATSAAAAPSGLSLRATLPPATVEQIAQKGHIRFADALGAQEFPGGGHSLASYTVRTRESENKPSADSNLMEVRIVPAYLAIEDAKAQTTPDGVAISWTAPQQTVTGSRPPIESYRVYRAIADARDGGNRPKPKGTLLRIGDSPDPRFVDTQFEFGTPYVYAVRTVSNSEGQEIESSDSNLADVTPRDTFPPSAPQGLVTTLMRAPSADLNSAANPAYIELSWAIAPESDVVGYNVYRSEQAGSAGKRLNAELLPTPTFRDMTSAPDHVYFYTVTAVDRAGNESAASAPVRGSTAQ